MDKHHRSSLQIVTVFSLAFLLAMGALGAANAHAQSVINKKLNPPLLADEDVTTVNLSPDGNWLVYLTKQDQSKIVTLNSVSVAGGAAFKFTETIDPEILNLTPLSFWITPNSQWVIYLLNPGPANTIDIYRAPIAGGIPQLLCPSLPIEDGVQMLSISPDSNWLLYRANPDSNTWPDIFSVPMSGGNPMKLNQNPNVFWSEISLDSATVIYESHTTSHYFDLYSVPISGGPSTKLNGALSERLTSDSFFDISNDGSRVVYRAVLPADGSYPNLFSVASAGGNSVMLNLPFEYEGYVSSESIGQNIDYVLFATRERLYEGAVPISKIFSVPIEGGNPVRLDSFNADPSTYEIWDFGPSRDGLLALMTQQNKDTYFNAAGIYSTPISGGTPTRLDPPGIIGVDEELGWWYDLPPGNKNLFLTTTLKGMFYAKNIYSVSLPDGTSRKLSPELASNEFLQVALVPTPQRIFYITFRGDIADWLETTGLHTVTLDGGNTIRMNSELVEGGHIGVLAASPDNRTVYYLADQDTDEVRELYSSTLTCASEQPHSADANHDFRISFSEVLRSVQLYNVGGVSCMGGTEDGYCPGDSGDHFCGAYSGDYNPQDWVVDFPELLRLIQLYKIGHYYACPGVGEDGFCSCEL